jgi:predicted nuclease of predicted toxin-antitoxin system
VNILLDENLDWRLRRDLPGHTVESVPLIGWAGLKNSALLEEAERRFDVPESG